MHILVDIDLYDTCIVTDSLVCMHRLTCRMVAIVDIECIQVPNQRMQVSSECAPVSSLAHSLVQAYLQSAPHSEGLLRNV